ncbi:hypothetical protein HDV05_001532 [Chytridiales sp. JEL 0842]|nr:hypothetical protein HDV05_001532 [Chytridiales sp. JEL 0842]
MENVTFCDVDSEDIRYVDPNYIKLFKVSQMIIEYLLHSQDYLADHRATLIEDLATVEQKLELLTDTYDKQCVEFNAMKRENRTLKKTLYAYQLMTRVPNSNGEPVAVASYHRCDLCHKVFKAAYYLDSHIQRRHPEHHRTAPPISTTAATSTSAGPSCSHLTERSTSIRGLFDQDSSPSFVNLPPLPGKNELTYEKMEETLTKFTERMMETEKALRIEMESKMLSEIKKKEAEEEEKRVQEKLKYEKEIQEMKGMIHTQMENERAAFAEEKAALEELLKKAEQAHKKSALGTLEDDDGESPKEEPINKESLQKFEEKQAQAILAIRDKFEEEMKTMQKALIEAAQKDKAAVEEKLSQANAQLSTLKKDLEQKQRAPEPVAVAPAPVETKMKKSKDSLAESKPTVVKKSKDSLVEVKPVEKKEEVVVEDVVTKVEVTDVVQVRSLHEDFDQLKPMRDAFQLKWEEAVELMDKHHYTPIPSAPWIKSLFAQMPDEIAVQRLTHEKIIDSELGDVQGFLNGDSDAEEGVRKKVGKLEDAFRKKVGEKGEVLGQLRDYLEDQVERIAEKEFKPSLTIVTKMTQVPYERRSSTRSRSVPPNRMDTSPNPKSKKPPSGLKGLSLNTSLLRSRSLPPPLEKSRQPLPPSHTAKPPPPPQASKPGGKQATYGRHEEERSRSRTRVKSAVDWVVGAGKKRAPSQSSATSEDSDSDESSRDETTTEGGYMGGRNGGYDKDEETASSRTSSVASRFKPPPPVKPVSYSRVPGTAQAQSPLKTVTGSIKSGFKKAFEVLNNVGATNKKSKEELNNLERSSSSLKDVNRPSQSHSNADKLLPRPKDTGGKGVRMRNMESESEYETDATDESEEEDETNDSITASSESSADNAVRGSKNSSSGALLSRQAQGPLMAIPHRSTNTIPEENEESSDLMSNRSKNDLENYRNEANSSSGSFRPVSHSLPKQPSNNNAAVARSNVKSPSPGVEESFDVSELSGISEDHLSSSHDEVEKFSPPASGGLGTKPKENTFFGNAPSSAPNVRKEQPKPKTMTDTDISDLLEDFDSDDSESFGGTPRPKQSALSTAKMGNVAAKPASKLSGLNDVNWEVHVIDYPQRNAFVLPGGKVFVFTGILPIVKNEDGLAAVIGHEVAHQVARHSAEKLSWVKVIVLAQIFMSFFFDPGFLFNRLFMELGVMLPFSRASETEADYIGLTLMAGACYDPHAAVAMWQV